MPYLSAALKEAMRMFPVVSLMARATDRVMRVGGFTVPSGTIVATPLFAIHNTVHNWDEPHSFRPERFLDVPVEAYVYNSKGEEAGGKRGITFMPFRCAVGSTAGVCTGFCTQRTPSQRCACVCVCLGGDACADMHAAAAPRHFAHSEGPRNCVGQSLAKMEVMTLLAKLLASFQIELAPEMGGREGIRARESTAMTLQTTGTKGIRCASRNSTAIPGEEFEHTGMGSSSPTCTVNLSRGRSQQAALCWVAECKPCCILCHLVRCTPPQQTSPPLLLSRNARCHLHPRSELVGGSL